MSPKKVVAIWLKNARKHDLETVGGKGANLGELLHAKFRVPDGFIITAGFYRYSISRSGIAPKINQILSKLDFDSDSNINSGSKKLRSLINSMRFDADEESKIRGMYKKIGGPVAVRSSATTEDLKEASFAGQQETFLNVYEKTLIDSIKKCMSSLYTPRAIAYRHEMDVDKAQPSIAVVVQRMVDARAAGVAFSVNPSTNNENELVIEAVAGLGEAVVNGGVTPDRYTLSKSNEIKEKVIQKSAPVLSEKEAKKIAVAVNKIADYFKAPQDVEWAIDAKGELHVLQARPITTLQNATVPKWKKIIAREYGVQYAELSLRSLSNESRFIVPKPFYGQVYIPEDGNEVCYMNEKKWNDLVASLKEKYLDKPSNYENFEKLFLKTGSDYVKTAKKIAKSDLRNKSDSVLKTLYRDYQDSSLRYAPFIWIQFIVNTLFAERVKEVLTRNLGDHNPTLSSLYGVLLKPKKKAAVMRLHDLAQDWGVIGAREQLKAYESLKWIPCLDIHDKPWTKEEFFVHINEFKNKDTQVNPSMKHVLKKLKLSKSEWQIIDITRRLTYLKDLKDDFRREGVFYGRALLEELGRRLGLNLDEISYLLDAEIIGSSHSDKNRLKKLAKERKEGFVICFSSKNKITCKSGRNINTVLKPLGLLVEQVHGGEIKGAVASCGKARGKVSIVKTVADLKKVKTGDVLVAVTTHPDYVPAMRKASAIVTDEGGITSHAAIVSRELNLPCVVGTKIATKVLNDGDIVEVDGDSGKVFKI